MIGKIPDDVIKVTSEYRDYMDTVGRFLKECCIDDKKSRVEFASLYVKYERWSVAVGEDVISKKAVAKGLKNKGYIQGRIGGNIAIYRGLKLKDFIEEEIKEYEEALVKKAREKGN